MQYSDFKISTAEEGLLDTAAGIAAGIGVFTIPFAILGLSMRHQTKKAAKARKIELDKWFTSKGLSTDPTDMQKYIDSMISTIADKCLAYAKKIESSPKFKSEAEKMIKSAMDQCAKENKENDSERRWDKYKPGEVNFTPYITRLLDDYSVGIALVANNGKLENRIYAEEDGDDNAPIIYARILKPILKPVADAVITKIQDEFSDVISAGLVTIEATNSNDTDIYDVLAIGINGEKISKSKK